MEKSLSRALQKARLAPGDFPYYCIISDDFEVRNIVTEELSKFVNPLEDYSFLYPGYEKIKQALQKRSIVLLNLEEKIKEYQSKGGFDFKVATYLCFIQFREHFVKFPNTIYVVCDREVFRGMLWNGNLSSVTNFNILDDKIVK